MIDNLTDAIAHAREVAKKNKNLAKTYESFKDYGNPKSYITSGHKRCLECATEHEQLAEWLTELKERRDEECPFTWGGDLDNKEIICLIREHMRIHSKKEPVTSARLNKAFLIMIEKLETDRWIPVSERLPEDRKKVRVTAYWHERFQVMDASYYGDGVWWCVPFNNCGEHMRNDLHVIAWKPDDEPYESEDK